MISAFLRPRAASKGVGPMRVRAVAPGQLAPETIAAWSDLEARSLEPNVYLSPHFVLPALRFLDPDLKAVVLLVEAGPPLTAATQLVGVLVGHVVPGRRVFPLPHLVAYKSRHSYLTGLLLDRDHAADALAALLTFVRSQGGRWHGVQFREIWGDGPTYDVLATVCERQGMLVEEWDAYERAVLFPRTERDRVEAALAAESRQQRRRIRRLHAHGDVRWAFADLSGGCNTAASTFLDLEHRGWKGEHGSSLRSTAAGESFFRAVATALGAEHRALFAELSVDGRVIASSSNFVSGRAAYAFKIGWLPELHQLSPGVQAELRLMQDILTHQRLMPIEFWDSGAMEGSYMERLWPCRRRVVSLAVGATQLAALALRGIGMARLARRRWRGRATNAPSSAAT